jgi:AbrB family looped-hinge helix DNA binding protein
MPRSLRISSKGQITVPIEVRECLGVKAGDLVEFFNDEGKQVLRPVQPEENPFARFAGCLPAFGSMDEINAWVREMRGHDPETL